MSADQRRRLPAPARRLHRRASVCEGLDYRILRGLCECFPHRSSTIATAPGSALFVARSSGCAPSPMPPPRALRRVLAFVRACPAASPPSPSAAARSCLCPPCCERPARGALRGSSDTNLAHTRIAAERRPSAQPRIAAMPTALPRRPKQARTMRISFYESDARSPAVAPARSQIQNKVGRGIRRGYLRVGPQAAYTLRVGAAAPFLSMRPQRRSQSRGLPEHDVLCSQPREIVRDDARSLPRSV